MNIRLAISFKCLEGEDVMTAEISDHYPIIHNRIVFWNIMKQCAPRNNGFGKKETEKQYKKRLFKVASVIAEMASENSDIEAIALCEGPINSHANVFNDYITQFESLRKFKNHSRHDPHFEAWGLLLFVDAKYKLKMASWNFSSTSLQKLTNRFQLFQLKNQTQKKFLALAHFPFEKNDEQATKREQLSDNRKIYLKFIMNLLEYFKNEHFSLSADFNFNPFLISEYQDRYGDSISHNNSQIVLTDAKESKTTHVTVDGILLSKAAKQRFFHHLPQLELSRKLKKELSLSSQENEHQEQEMKYDLGMH
jgi:hypothetical protein